MTRKTSLGMATIVCSSLLVTLALTSSAFAASACKGMEKRQCEGKSDCTWVDGYTRKDGVTVASHCKSVGKKGSSNKDDKKSDRDKS